MAGILTFLILIKNWKILIVSFSLLTFFVFLILTIPSLNKAFNKIVLKDFNTVLESRTYLWEPSVKAAKIGGLVGLGYGISEPNILVPGTGSHYESERYIREKGNSLLALIEETGIIGLILFLLPVGYIILKSNKLQTRFYERRTLNIEQSPVPDSAIEHNQLLKKSFNHSIIQSFNHSLLLSTFAAFLLHSQFEAWMVGVGSVQLPLFFILIGLTVQCSKFEVIG